MMVKVGKIVSLERNRRERNLIWKKQLEKQKRWGYHEVTCTTVNQWTDNSRVDALVSATMRAKKKQFQPTQSELPTKKAGAFPPTGEAITYRLTKQHPPKSPPPGPTKQKRMAARQAAGSTVQGLYDYQTIGIRVISEGACLSVALRPIG